MTRSALKAINVASIALLEELRAEWESAATPCVISGAIGPRGDGYKAGNMDAEEAEAYHGAQIAAFAGTNADMVSAYTLTNINEAIGIARAAKGHGMPCAISFTVETDGRLVTGQDAARSHRGGQTARLVATRLLPDQLRASDPFRRRARGRRAMDQADLGVKANASTKSHAELDESETLGCRRSRRSRKALRLLTRSFPTMRILGGCCGTDHRHVAAICGSCVPPLPSVPSGQETAGCCRRRAGCAIAVAVGASELAFSESSSRRRTVGIRHVDRERLAG